MKQTLKRRADELIDRLFGMSLYRNYEVAIVYLVAVVGWWL